MKLSKEIIERIELLNQKYKDSGQDLKSYLDGLLHAQYLTYWDYIHLDTLLSLQTPKTAIPDEQIFIMYHQITELYFKLCLHELEQVKNNKECNADFIISKVGRVNKYFENLTHSFDIMVDGMDQKQFLEFRMSLLPASGFQSGQYRMIELYATQLLNLVDVNVRANYTSDSDVNDLYANIYWKNGATDLSTGTKTLTLMQFEEKYDEQLIKIACKNYKNTILDKFKNLSAQEQQNPKLIATLKQLDINVNINWPLSHYRSAVRYLQQKNADVDATGGTNWQKYLPPRFQKRIFFPEIWTAEEHAEWGKKWVESALS